MRLTAPVVHVLAALTIGDAYGRAIMARTGLPSGTVYPILARLEAAGLIASSTEDAHPAALGRPLRRLYHLTPDDEQQESTR